jgi:hypothetical protein
VTIDDERDDELLAAAAAGERGEDDAELVALFARDPAARERLHRMRTLAASLDRAGVDQRVVVAERVLVSGRHAALVREAVGGRRRRGVPRSWLLLAALLGIAGVIAVVPWSPRAPRPDDVLGTDRLAGTPVGTVAEYGEFRWNLPRPRDGWFELVFLDDRDHDRGRELLRVPELSEQRWTPEAAHREAMTDGMVWRVDAIEAGRVTASAGPFEVRRR